MEHRDRLWPGGYTFLYDDGLFRPSTDTFLLGAFPRLRRGMTVCELGAGTGLLSLLLEARLGGGVGLTVEPPLLLHGPDGGETEDVRRAYFRDKEE